MADASVVHIGENSPEQVAYKLLVHIAATEDYWLRQHPVRGEKQPDRKWLLDTYAECLEATRGHRSVKR